MSMERMWDMASTISAIAGLFVSAILVAKIYVPYMIKKKSAVLNLSVTSEQFRTEGNHDIRIIYGIFVILNRIADCKCGHMLYYIVWKIDLRTIDHFSKRL